MNTPAISAMGMDRSGLLNFSADHVEIIPAVIGPKAATSAAMKPAIPPFAPRNVVPKLLQVPVAAEKPAKMIATIMTSLSAVKTS